MHDQPAEQTHYRAQLDALVQELREGERGPRIAVDHAKGIKFFKTLAPLRMWKPTAIAGAAFPRR